MKIDLYEVNNYNEKQVLVTRKPVSNYVTQKDKTYIVAKEKQDEFIKKSYNKELKIFGVAIPALAILGTLGGIIGHKLPMSTAPAKAYTTTYGIVVGLLCGFWGVSAYNKTLEKNINKTCNAVEIK